MVKVLVFDSGVGGFSIVQEVRNCKLDVELFYCADTAFFPYGSRSDLELLERIPAIVCKAAEVAQADVLIIACNTASTLALWQIRQSVSIPVIGVVPAIKPAAILSETKTIGLLATPRTVGSAYTNDLIDNFASDCKVLRYAPKDLARAAEGFILGQGLDEGAIDDAINGLFDQEYGKDIDVVVLACTHYPLLFDALAARAPHDVKWIDSGFAIANRLAQILNLKINEGETKLGIALSSGGDDRNFCDAAIKQGFYCVVRLE